MCKETVSHVPETDRKLLMFFLIIVNSIVLHFNANIHYVQKTPKLFLKCFAQFFFQVLTVGHIETDWPLGVSLTNKKINLVSKCCCLGRTKNFIKI